jgi:uncharacterized UPF0160 family protein
VITELVTHSGGFHADELLSSVVLTRLYPDATIIRTRDPALTQAAEGRVVYDVGRGYDADAGLFDHHQDPTPCRDDGRPYSSFGLIWRHFGERYLDALGIAPEWAANVHRGFDENFVVPIDLMDNGALDPSVAGPLAGMTLPALLEALKPAFDARSPQEDDAAFLRALEVARALVEGKVQGMAAKHRAEALVLKAVAEAGASPLLELPAAMPFRGAVDKAGADHLLFVVHPRDADWALTTIRKSEHTFESRADLPRAWAGLTDGALEAASGVRGAKFCHSARFLAVAESRAAIMAMAERALAEAEGQDTRAP